MLLGGLWHGAAWNFVIWGGLHGAAARVPSACAARHRHTVGLPAPVRIAMTFVLVLMTWVFFRAAICRRRCGISATWPVSSSATMAPRCSPGSSTRPYYLGTFVLAAIVTWVCPQTWDWTRVADAAKAVVVAALFVLCAVLLTTQAYNPFIYFIF